MSSKLKELDKRIEILENKFKDFMDNWGPDVQRRRDERDERWDEMVRVLTIQERQKEREQSIKFDNKGKLVKTDIHNNVYNSKRMSDKQYDFAEDVEGEKLISQYNRNRPSSEHISNVNEIPK
tara:strand:- start:1966 stop:2334 length:369 start_codon:yes stop_codon:yes gene_type:complete